MIGAAFRNGARRALSAQAGGEHAHDFGKYKTMSFIGRGCFFCLFVCFLFFRLLGCAFFFFFFTLGFT
jgi:hypothetical protein